MPDFSQPFLIQTDWSQQAMGAVLSQIDEDEKEYVVAYASKTNNKAQANYSPTEGECLAVVWAVEHFKPYHYFGAGLTLQTDHAALRWLMTCKNLSGRLQRWALRLQGYAPFTIDWRPGRKHNNADALSRLAASVDPDSPPPALTESDLPTPTFIVGTPLHDEDLDLPSWPCYMVLEDQPSSSPGRDKGKEPDSPNASPATATTITDQVPEEATDATTAEAGATPCFCQICHELITDPFDQCPHCSNASNDIFLDNPVMHYLKTGRHAAGLEAAEKNWVLKRASRYVFKEDDQLYFLSTVDGVKGRVVPPPDLRPGIIKSIHEEHGHFRGHRTTQLVLRHYYWPGIYKQSAEYVDTCDACKATDIKFDIKPQLKSVVPPQQPFFQVAIDLKGTLPESATGNTYVVVVIDYTTKWVEAAAIPNKESSCIADFFTHYILARHGTPAVVITDNGTEWQGSFAKLLQANNIDVNTTSCYHPQSNGLVERFNKTLGGALIKYASDHPSAWDTYLPNILMGYRFGIQASTKFSPFELLHNRHPMLIVPEVEHVALNENNYGLPFQG